MMIKILMQVFLLFQVSIDLFECFVDENNTNSVETCFTQDNRPAFCVDQTLCNKIDKSLMLGPLENCPNSEKVCCPFTHGESEYRDAFVVPSGLAWDWTQSWPNLPWTVIKSTPKPATVAPVATSNASTPAAPASPNLNQGCGVRSNVNIMGELENDLGFIVGGQEAIRNSWPWAIALYSNNRFVCGGSIIGNRHILCAAHCVYHNKMITVPKDLKVMVGAHNRAKADGKMYDVDEVFVHSKYDEKLMQNDISIFKLKESIPFSKTASPVCLPTCDQCPDSSKTVAHLAGWGTTAAGGKVSDVLQDVKVSVVPLAKCQQSYDSRMVTSKQICAGTGLKDSCQGDSGGPMVVQPQAKENKFVQCGIVSWGKGCADPSKDQLFSDLVYKYICLLGYPGVYTKTCEFMDWIKDKIKNY